MMLLLEGSARARVGAAALSQMVQHFIEVLRYLELVPGGELDGTLLVDDEGDPPRAVDHRPQDSIRAGNAPVGVCEEREIDLLLTPEFTLHGQIIGGYPDDLGAQRHQIGVT